MSLALAGGFFTTEPSGKPNRIFFLMLSFKRTFSLSSFTLIKSLFSSFFLQLLVIALFSSAVAYWTPSYLGGLSSGLISFYLFMLFMEFSRQEHWSGFPFLLPVDCLLSELSTMTHLSWVALHGMAHSSTELRKPLHHNKAMIHEGVTLLDTTQLQFNFPDGFSLSTFYEVVSLL